MSKESVKKFYELLLQDAVVVDELKKAWGNKNWKNNIWEKNIFNCQKLLLSAPGVI